MDIFFSVLMMVCAVIAAAVVVLWHAVIVVMWVVERLRKNTRQCCEPDAVARSLECIERDTRPKIKDM